MRGAHLINDFERGPSQILVAMTLVKWNAHAQLQQILDTTKYNKSTHIGIILGQLELFIQVFECAVRHSRFRYQLFQQQDHLVWQELKTKTRKIISCIPLKKSLSMEDWSVHAKSNQMHFSLCWNNKANLRDLIAATGLVFLHKIGFKSLMWPENWMEDLENQQGTSSIQCQVLCIISKPLVNSNLSYSPETPNLGQNWWYFVPCDLKFDRWHWKTIGHLFYATSSFVHHFIAICKFKMEL